MTIPTLPPRSNVFDKFCQCILVIGDSSQITWQSDQILAKNLALYQAKQANFSQLDERAIANFWLKIVLDRNFPKANWEPDQRELLALKHLTCYCESACYQVIKEFQQTGQNNLNWEDIFDQGRNWIYNRSEFVRFLAKYDSQTNNLLPTFIRGVLYNKIGQQMIIAKFSRWRLLSKASDKILQEALKDSYSDQEIPKFLFVRGYFKQIYRQRKVDNPHIRRRQEKWPEPDADDFQETANYYNREKLLSIAPYEVYASQDITGVEVQKWMENCIQSLQDYIQPNLPENTLPIDESEELLINNDDRQDDDNETSFLPAKKLLLRQQLTNLPASQIDILVLRYGLGISYKELEKLLSSTQSTLAHRLSAARHKLLKTLAEEMPKPTELVSKYLTVWLQRQPGNFCYPDLIHTVLIKARLNLTQIEITVLELSYEQQLSPAAIAANLGIDMTEVVAIRQAAKAKLESELLTALTKWTKQSEKKLISQMLQELLAEAADRLSSKNGDCYAARQRYQQTLINLNLRPLEQGIIYAICDECLQIVGVALPSRPSLP